jgi:hypothetical protein
MFSLFATQQLSFYSSYGYDKVIPKFPSKSLALVSARRSTYNYSPASSGIPMAQKERRTTRTVKGSVVIGAGPKFDQYCGDVPV